MHESDSIDRVRSHDSWLPSPSAANAVLEARQRARIHRKQQDTLNDSLQFLRPADVCRLLRISKPTLWGLRRDGFRAPTELTDRAITWRRSEVEAWPVTRTDRNRCLNKASACAPGVNVKQRISNVDPCGKWGKVSGNSDVVAIVLHAREPTGELSLMVVVHVRQSARTVLPHSALQTVLAQFPAQQVTESHVPLQGGSAWRANGVQAGGMDRFPWLDNQPTTL